MCGIRGRLLRVHRRHDMRCNLLDRRPHEALVESVLFGEELLGRAFACDLGEVHGEGVVEGEGGVGAEEVVGVLAHVTDTYTWHQGAVGEVALMCR